MSLRVVILAAGKGKRMMSKKPKVLHELGGMPMLERVVNTAQALNPEAIYVVHGNGGDEVKAALNHLPVEWIPQVEQLGTGHAVSQAIPQCSDEDQVLVLYGDVPIITKATLEKLLQDTPSGLGLIVTEVADPGGFGRIVRNELGNIVAIVEHKDANESQLNIKEINTGIMTTRAGLLKTWLPLLQNNNTQKEYYLTDIVSMAVADGHPVGGILSHCPEEVRGVNDRWQQAELERYFQYRQAKALADAGVSIMDVRRLDIRGELTAGQDVCIDINVLIEGKVTIGENTRIGANVIIKNASIGDNVTIHPNTIIENATIADHAELGPFARIRPGTTIHESAKVGNFVELKNTELGEHSKASHLAYLGDSKIGKHVNIGAGTITCNYDGIKKHKTTVEDGAFVGSNTSLVAPVTVGKEAFIGAGTTLTKSAPDNALSLSRSPQRTIDNWNKKKDN